MQVKLILTFMVDCEQFFSLSQKICKSLHRVWKMAFVFFFSFSMRSFSIYEPQKQGGCLVPVCVYLLS